MHFRWTRYQSPTNWGGTDVTYSNFGRLHIFGVVRLFAVRFQASGLFVAGVPGASFIYLAEWSPALASYVVSSQIAMAAYQFDGAAPGHELDTTVDYGAEGVVLPRSTANGVGFNGHYFAFSSANAMSGGQSVLSMEFDFMPPYNDSGVQIFFLAN